MTKKALVKGVLVCTSLMIGTVVWAQTYRVALMELPSTALYRELVLAIADEAGAKLDIQVVPPARLVALVQSKAVDIGCPQLVSHNPEALRTLPIDISTDVIYDSAFVLYSNKAKPVDLANLKSGNPKGYVVETDLSNLTSFEFKGSPTTNLEGSLTKVDSGTVDGFIFSQTAADLLLKKLGLKKINRQLYDYFKLAFAIQKGARGGPADRMLSAGLKKMRADGRFEKIMGQYIATAKYNDWQP
jgi:polar amino acid transport system substrate-binding protein